MKKNIKDNDTVQYIVVQLGGEQYGINIRYVDNIVRMQKITRVPKVQHYFKGVINLRGEVMPVMSIRSKMGLPEDEFTDDTRIIILKAEEKGSLGVIIDAVKEVVTLAPEEIDKVAYDAKDERSNFINGIGKHGEELVSLFDINCIIGEKEAV